jgi:hypothetical protein
MLKEIDSHRNPRETPSVQSLGFTCVKRPFLRGVLNNFPAYSFSSPYYYIYIFKIYILKPPYINYNPLFQIITYHVL